MMSALVAELLRDRIGAPQPDERVLGKLATSFLERLPLGLDQMRAVLASDGCAADCRELRDVLDYYRARAARAPFQIVRFGGMEIAVAPAQARLAAHVAAAAVRMVEHWGIVNRRALTERAEVIATASVPELFVEKIVTALPATVWLDGPAREWFSFKGKQRDSGLGQALDKIIALDRAIFVPELREALAKAVAAVNDLPLAAFERYLVEVGGCVIDGGRVSRPGPLATTAMSKPEAALVGILGVAGGRLDPSSLRRRAAEAGLSAATLTRLLRFSPLVARTQSDEIRLVGVPSRAASAGRPAVRLSGALRSRPTSALRQAS